MSLSPKSDFLKIAVEGFEEEVIAGADHILREHRPFIMVEVGEKTKDSVISHLDRIGYQVMPSFAASTTRMSS